MCHLLDANPMHAMVAPPVARHTIRARCPATHPGGRRGGARSSTIGGATAAFVGSWPARRRVGNGLPQSEALAATGSAIMPRAWSIG